MVSTTAPHEISRPSANLHAANAAVRNHQFVRFAFDHLKIGRGADRGLHGLRIELAIGLRARTAHGRTFAAIQKAKLDAALIGHPAHEAVQRVDFPHQVAFAEAADGRIA